MYFFLSLENINYASLFYYLCLNVFIIFFKKTHFCSFSSKQKKICAFRPDSQKRSIARRVSWEFAFGRSALFGFGGFYLFHPPPSIPFSCNSRVRKWTIQSQNVSHGCQNVRRCVAYLCHSRIVHRNRRDYGSSSWWYRGLILQFPYFFRSLIWLMPLSSFSRETYN